MKEQNKKTSLQKSKYVLEEKRKTVKQKIFIKGLHKTFTIFAMNFVQKQINISVYFTSSTICPSMMKAT